MGTYSMKGKGWRYDFTLKGERYTQAWFKNKREAVKAENERRKEVGGQNKVWKARTEESPKMPTDMDFLELVNRRLDFIKAYNSRQHYLEHISRAKRWAGRWAGRLSCEILEDDIQEFILERSRVSNHTANKELIRLRAMFNHGVRKGWIYANPTTGIEKLPEEKRLPYVPSPEVVEKVIAEADRDTQDYLWLIRDSMARVGEINKLTWDDVDLTKRFIVLYTRKKKGGSLTPRKVPMSDRAHLILLRRYRERAFDKPWVFWHEWNDTRSGEKRVGPYRDRKRIMKTLCKNAKVPYFRFHALRHSGASTLDEANVPTGVIQRLLGHESRETTEIYLHALRDTDRSAVAVFDGKVIPFPRHNSHTDSHTDKKASEEQSA